VFEPDERRIEIFRTSLDDFDANKVRISDLPEAYLHVRGFHLQWGTMAQLDELVAVLLDGNPDMTLVWEPSPDHLDQPREAFERLLPRLALFSPDIGEAQQITGQSDPADAARVLLDWGAPLVAIRMGERGSLLRTPAGERWQVPAVPAPIVDVTGAGNSFCGGFLTGLGDGLPPLEAALRAAVSASFALQQFGMPNWTNAPTEEAEKRLAWARDRVKPLPA
jgi:ribokinase